MKAIEIKYAGLHFRSKTEAKWALFMDMIGCKYIYEPEGYDLGDSVFYCPDFYLPDIDTFLEIKPIIGGIPSHTKKLAEQSRKRVITMHGSPRLDDDDMGICEELGLPDYDEGGYVAQDECGKDHGYAFCICPLCALVGIEFRGRGERLKCGCTAKDPLRRHKYCHTNELEIAVATCYAAFKWGKNHSNEWAKAQSLPMPRSAFFAIDKMIDQTTNRTEP